MRSVRNGARKRPSSPVWSVVKNLALLVGLLAAFYAAKEFLGPNFLHDQVRGALAFGAAVGEWVRHAMAAAFTSIPVR